MAFPAIGWAMTWLGGLTSSERLVLIMLADAYNLERAQAWPSQAALAEATALDVRTIKRCIKSLEAQGLIQVARRRTGPQKQAVNVYRFPLFSPESEPVENPLNSTATK